MLEGQEDMDLQESSEQEDHDYDEGWDLDDRSGSDEQLSDKKKTETAKKNANDDGQQGDEDHEGNGDSDDDPEGSESKADKDETAQSRLEDRAKEKVGDEDQQGGQDDQSDSAADTRSVSGDSEQQSTEQDGAEDLEITDDDVADILKYPVPLPKKIKTENGEINLDEIEEDFGEVAAYSKLMAAYIADQTVKHYLSDLNAGGNNEEIAELKSVNEQLTNRLNELESNLAVAEKHPDYRTIKADKGFETWLKKQSPGVQKLAESPDAEDRVYILDAYKETKSKDTAKRVDAENAKKKERYDSLHRGTLRSKPPTDKKKSGKDMNDYDAGWNDV